MRGTLREMRRAPVRVAASIAAIALAIAAIGVFAVPGVAQQSLRTIAAEDQLTHLQLTTTPFDRAALPAGIEGVDVIEGRTSGSVDLRTGQAIRVTSTSPGDEIDRLRIEAGRQPTGPDEGLASPGMGLVGDIVTVSNGTEITIVGVGTTTRLATEDVLFTTPETARQLTGVDGYNTVLARLDEPTEENLDRTVSAARGRLAEAGVTLTTFAVTLPDGAHPIEQDLVDVSFMIGSLGVVAGIVALILLASTANAIVTERTADSAVLRALGGTRPVVRRTLRRPAIAIGVVGTIVGLPLGLVVANSVAKMVLERFAGISPGIGFSVPVLLGSAAFGIIGARLVSGRAARRVARQELATAMRDKQASPFGARRLDRLLTRLPIGGLTSRLAVRSVARGRGRAIAVAAQFGGGVAAAVLVATLGTSIGEFNQAELATYRWDAVTNPVDPIHPYRLDHQADGTAEVGIHDWGEVDGWEMELFGVDPDTVMFDTAVTGGAWLPAGGTGEGPAPVVLAKRFADQVGYRVGDELTVELANGPARYHIVGLHPIRSVALFAPAQTLSTDLGTTGSGNTVWSIGDVDPAGPAATAGVAQATVTRAGLSAEDTAARDAILAIFAAIGAIVVAVAVLGVASTVAMNQYDRRAELATMRATGAPRRDIRRLVGLELGGLALVGWAVGIGAGIWGASAIMGFFATANAVELGFQVAWIAVPATAVGTAVLVLALAAGTGRQIGRRSPAATLRAAT